MGRVSKELKELKERKAEYPEEDKDYYVVRARKGEKYHMGYIRSYYSRNQITPAVVIQQLDYVARGLIIPNKNLAGMATVHGLWFIYPGPRPDKKWGPVCP